MFNLNHSFKLFHSKCVMTHCVLVLHRMQLVPFLLFLPLGLKNPESASSPPQVTLAYSVCVKKKNKADNTAANPNLMCAAS